MKIKLEDGKYTVIFNESTGDFHALRYGEVWRDLCGDGLVLALCQEIESLRTELQNKKKINKEYWEAVSYVQRD